MSEHTKRKNIKIGEIVDIVLKEDQSTGKLTRGIVKNILTKKSIHPRGIKVRLANDNVGRVQQIIKNQPPPEWHEKHDDFIIGY